LKNKNKSPLVSNGISVIAPCLNEEHNVAPLLKRFEQLANVLRVPLEIIIVDDGSLDNTFQNVSAYLSTSKFLVIKSIQHSENLGIFESWRTGIDSSQYDLCAFIDGDLQNRPENLENFVEVYNNSFSRVIIGNRVSQENLNFRSVLSKSLAAILRVVFKTKLRDPKTGFVFGEKTVLQAALSNLSELKLSMHHTFIGIELERCGIELREIVTDFDSRFKGVSFLRGKTLVTCLKVLLDILRYKYQQKELSESKLYEITWGRRLLYFLYFKSMRLHSWNLTGATYDKFKKIILLERLSADEWKEYQKNELLKLLQYVCHSIQYYEKIEFTGPSSLVKELHSFPLLEKETLKSSNHFVLLNPRIKFRHRIRTSGSTGTPLEIYADREQLEFRFASTVRALRWTGWEIGRRQMRLWHQKIGMTKFQIIMERIDALLMRRTFIPAFEISDNKMNDLLNRMRKVSPWIIDGYAESFEYISRYLTNVDDFKIPVVMSSAQTLTERSRKVIEERFSCKVYDKYGAREFSGIAYQCGFGNWYHIIADSYVVEVLVDGIRPAMPGEIGEVVITDLRNRVMPLIRYRIGDLAIALDQNLKCPCGRNMPLIGPIIGRTTAIVYTPKGMALPGTFFAHFFKEYVNLIDQYQILQDEDFTIKLLLKKGRSFSQESFEAMINQLESFMVGVTLEIEFVDLVPLTETGKRTAIISKIKHPIADKEWIPNVLQ